LQNSTTGSGPEIAFGQINLSTTAANQGNLLPGQSTLSNPQGIYVDKKGTLWVSEEKNNRVVWYQNASSVTSSGPLASGVLGQADFISTTLVGGNNAFYSPVDLTVNELTGDLWVVDQGGSRVMRFTGPQQKASGISDVVLGQPGYGTPVPGTSSSLMDTPFAMRFTPDGGIFVADSNNNRVVWIALHSITDSF